MHAQPYIQPYARANIFVSIAAMTEPDSAEILHDTTVAEAPVLVDADGSKYLPPVRANAFLGLVRAGEGLARDLDGELQAAHGLSLRAFEVLLHLAVFAPTRCLRMTKLAEQAPLSQSRVSRLVAELETKGLVHRSAVADDARGVEVAITERGLRLFADAQDTHLDGLERRLFSRLTWDETAQLAQITAKLLADNEPP